MTSITGGFLSAIKKNSVTLYAHVSMNDQASSVSAFKKLRNEHTAHNKCKYALRIAKMLACNGVNMFLSVFYALVFSIKICCRMWLNALE